MQVYSQTKPNKRAILFFAGWGMDHNPFSHLAHKGLDLYIFYNYSSLGFTSCPDDEKCTPECSRICVMQHILDKYQEIYVIGFGFGVWCASAAFDKYLIRLSGMSPFSELKFWAKIKRCIAINGTLMPISREWGINQETFLQIMDSLPDSSTMEQLLHKMCHTKKEYDFFLAHAPQRAPLQTKKELQTIKEQLFLSNSLTWDTSITGTNDFIFATSRQLTFWDTYSSIAQGGYIPCTRRRFSHRNIQLEGSHYLFNRFGSWDEIIDL